MVSDNRPFKSARAVTYKSKEWTFTTRCDRIVYRKKKIVKKISENKNTYQHYVAQYLKLRR